MARRQADGHMAHCAHFKAEMAKEANGDVVKIKQVYMNCGQGPHNDGVKLSKYARCKNVSYCSKDCQRADWKNHKGSCKLHTEINKE